MTLPKIVGPGDLAAVSGIVYTDDKTGLMFETLDNMPRDEAITMLYYGGAGIGKTWFVATAGPRTLIINIGNGLVTIQSPVIKKLYYSGGMPIVTTIHEMRDPVTGLFKTADAFDKVCDAIDIALSKFPDRFDTIAVDDATQLRSFASNKALEIGGEDGRSKTLEKGKKYGAVLMAQQDFLGEMNLIEQFVSGTVDLCKQNGKHFILTGHERYIYKKVKDQGGKVIGEEIERIRPAFTGKTFPDEITAHFDLVWHGEVAPTGNGPVFRAHTEDYGRIRAKSRFPQVFKSLEPNPNFLKIVATIKAAR